MSALLSIEVIACLVVAAATAFAVSVVLKYIRARDELNRKIRQSERALEKLRKQIAVKQGTIKQLQEEVAMLVPLHHNLQKYHDELLGIQLEKERDEINKNGERTKKEVKTKKGDWGSE